MSSKYITRMGDTWDLIAYEQLGSCKYVSLLIKENKEYCDTAIFSAGVVLNIPAITNKTKVENLPPWKTKKK